MSDSHVLRVATRGARLVVGVVALAISTAAFPAATIVIQNMNAAGEGFNDPTPVAPVGGNAGTTLGEQRLIAFAAAANIWGATLTSSVPIVIRASFEPLACTATGAVLGSAGAYNIWSDFAGAAFPDTWYPQALANKITGTNLSAGDPVDGQDIRARFNSRLGLFPDCLPGSPFYLGLDNNHGSMIDLFTVLLHEFGHGLGFQTFTDGNTGAPFFGLVSIWDYFLFDNTQNKTWVMMTDLERAVSARNARKLAWTGANVTGSVPGVLSAGTPLLTVSGSMAAAGTYDVGAAAFGPPLANPGLSGDIMPVVDQLAGTGLACNPLSGLNSLAVRNNIALVDRGVCSFKTKVLNAQNAGARAVIVVDNVVGSPPPGLGDDPTIPTPITIPSVRITNGDGAIIKNALKFRSRTRSGVIGTLGVNPSVYAGADLLGRALLFTPNPYQGGSSVSHWDTIAFPNQLMEPFINGDLTHSVNVPQDLTFKLLQDIGW